MKTTRQPLPADCLLGGRVHPSIAERLERVKQLPVAAVANYLGLEASDGGGYFMLWQALPAQPFAGVELSESQRARIADQLRRIIEAMHSHGIVHGAINAQTVLLDSAGNVHLTHISPLLYDDPEIDHSAVDKLFGHVSEMPAQDTQALALRQRNWWSVAVLAAAALLMFFGLLWYSQHR